MSSTIGTLLKVTTFGESHGTAIGAIIDGCPSRIRLSAKDIQPQLDRRMPGISAITTQRSEKDKVQILSGVQDGITLGTPICLSIANTDTEPGDYAELLNIPRPSHADYTYMMKYGVGAKSGGGRASARETAARVAAGGVAEKILKKKRISVVAWVSSVGNIDAPDMGSSGITRKDVDTSAVRCPYRASAKKMESLIRKAMKAKDSVGGIITCVCTGVPAGWGEPVFDKASALLASAMMSIPAAKGFEIGAGFESARLAGSVNNDKFVKKRGRLGTRTNRSGGIQGGITNGEPVIFRVAFKPPATIGKSQRTVDYRGRSVTLKNIKGRHDPCVLPRAVPVVESMAAIVLADLSLMAGAYGIK